MLTIKGSKALEFKIILMVCICLWLWLYQKYYSETI